MSESVVYTQEELEARCKVWQERLRIQDWDIKAALARLHEIKDECTAQARIHSTLKEALVQIMYPEDYQHRGHFMPQDMDLDICHELVHIHFPDLGNYEQNSRHYYQVEQGTESMARAFVAAWRRIEALETQPRLSADPAERQEFLKAHPDVRDDLAANILSDLPRDQAPIVRKAE